MIDFYFYTETAFHHEGDINFLKELIVASKNAGAQGIKFQVLTSPDDFISRQHTAYKDLSSFCLSFEEWRIVFQYALDHGLEVILMPLNIDSLRLVELFPIKFLEIHSVSFNDKALIGNIKQTQKDLILGIGGRTEEEINQLCNYFGSQVKVLMVGFQAFPSQLEDVKLSKIGYLKAKYPHVTIGYADHSSFDSIYSVVSNEYAYLLGARIFEKHITIQEGDTRVDSSAAISPEKIIESIKRLKFLTKCMGHAEDTFTFSEAEVNYRNRQLTCVASHDIEKDTVLTEEDISLKLLDYREGTNTKVDDLVGKINSEKILSDYPILKSQIK